jgi:hypothetical protein
MPVSDYYNDNLQIQRPAVTRNTDGSASTVWTALYTYSASTISFTADHTISDSANGFILAGFKAGQVLTVYDAGGFNRVTVTIDSLTAGVITTTAGSSSVVTKSAAASGLVKIDCPQTIKGYINESAGGKQFNIGQNVVTSTGNAFISFDYDDMAITEKDRIYNSDSGRYFEILFVKTPSISLQDKINWISIDVRLVK